MDNRIRFGCLCIDLKAPPFARTPTVVARRGHHTLITNTHLRLDMPQDVLSVDELTEIIADATGETPEEIEKGAKEIDIAPPEEGIVRNDEVTE